MPELAEGREIVPYLRARKFSCLKATYRAYPGTDLHGGPSRVPFGRPDGAGRNGLTAARGHERHADHLEGGSENTPGFHGRVPMAKSDLPRRR
jgi:hypothetical protein